MLEETFTYHDGIVLVLKNNLIFNTPIHLHANMLFLKISVLTSNNFETFTPFTNWSFKC